MTLCMAGFTFNDGFVKALFADMNMGQVLLLRGLFAAAILAIMAWQRNALRPVRLILQPMIILRIIGETGATLTFLTALAHIPFANVSAVLQALPLAVTMAAALFLAEPVGWRRWSAIIVGFTGVLVIVRPGMEGFSFYTLLVLATVAFAALRDIATRLVDHQVPTLFLSLVTAISVSLMGAALIGPLGGWRPVSAINLTFVALAACFLIVGYQFIILSMRAGDISFIAPFRYTGLLWAIMLGLVFFGEVPDVFVIVGATIIVASGLYTLYRESKVAPNPVAAEAPPRHS